MAAAKVKYPSDRVPLFQFLLWRKRKMCTDQPISSDPHGRGHKRGADLVLYRRAGHCPSKMKVEPNHKFFTEPEKLVLLFGTFAAFSFPHEREYWENIKSCQQYLNQQCPDLCVPVANTDVPGCFISTISIIFGLCCNSECYLTLNSSRKEGNLTPVIKNYD